VDAGRKLTVNTDAVEFNQIPETCKSQQIWKPSATQKNPANLNRFEKTVRESSIK
jgi:hypothetical protein